MDALTRYPWPGNVRELRNVIERALLMLEGEEIRIEHLPPNLRGEAAVPRLRSGDEAAAPSEPSDLATEVIGDELFAPGKVPSLTELERWGIGRAMAATGNNKTRAADLLGISRQTLRMKLKDISADEDDAPASVSH
jgi:DNA-binding NtrC family response regulator